MRHRDIFENQRLITKVALHQELKERQWQPPIQKPLKCPFCGSSSVRQLLIKQPGKTLICRGCEQQFSMEDIPGCTCWYPGKLLKCQDCRHYQQIVAGVNQRLSGELKDMTPEEASRLLADPNFYDQDRLMPEPLAPAVSPPEPPTALETCDEDKDEVEITQLDLFSNEQSEPS